MDTCCCPPGVRVPPAGLKVAPTSLLAVQSIFPVDFASSVKVTVHGPDVPQVVESKPFVLADQIRVGVGGTGVGVSVGVGVGGTGVGVFVGVGVGGTGVGVSVGVGVGGTDVGVTVGVGVDGTGVGVGVGGTGVGVSVGDGDGDGDGDGLTVGSGVGVGSAEGTRMGLQLHDTLTGLAPPVKVKLLFAQPTVMVTVVDWPGERVPLDGLNCVALASLDADHLRLPREPTVSVSVTLHCQAVVSDVQLFVSKLVGLAINIGCAGVQLHDEVMGFVPPDPEKVKVAAWQDIEEMVTSSDPPGDKVPFGGLKLTPGKLLLADQVRSP